MRSMMFLRTITLVGPVSFSALPSKIRTFLNRVTATLGAAVAALAAPELAGGDDTVARTVVGAAPLAALPASDPDGAPDGAQLAESMSAAIAVRNRTISRMEASLAGSVSRDGTLFFSACRGEILPRKVWVATCPPWSICVTAVRRVERQCCASLLRRLFGWTFDQSTAPGGQLVIVGRNARKNSEITSPIEVRTQANRIHRL